MKKGEGRMAEDEADQEGRSMARERGSWTHPGPWFWGLLGLALVVLASGWADRMRNEGDGQSEDRRECSVVEEARQAADKLSEIGWTPGEPLELGDGGKVGKNWRRWAKKEQGVGKASVGVGDLLKRESVLDMDGSLAERKGSGTGRDWTGEPDNLNGFV